MISSKPYRGVNNLLLTMEEFADPRFLTLKQANDLGLRVAKGEIGFPVEYWDWYDSVEKTDEKTGAKTKEKVKRDWPKIYHSTVFNASQIEGMPRYINDLRDKPILINENCEKVIVKMAVPIEFKGDDAFYLVNEDKIIMPSKSQFNDMSSYYGVALHELAHATGHENRLNRDTLLNYHKDKSIRAKEELRAEIASYFLASDLDVAMDSNHLQNHAGYVQSWIAALKNDKNEIYRAARDAELICDYMTKDLELSVTKERDLHKETVPKTKEKVMHEIEAKTDKNEYKGVITKITNQAIYQRHGANSIIKHDLKSFQKMEPVSVGSLVQFYYDKGKGEATVLSLGLENEKAWREASKEIGTYYGEILRVEKDYFLQAVSSNIIMKHNKADFPAIGGGSLKIGDQVKVDYSRGIGKFKTLEKKQSLER